MTPPADRITVWTVHPVEFDLAQPGLEYDHTQGYYWKGELPACRRYREVLPTLHQHFGVSAILWCFSSLIDWHVADRTKEVAWELDLPTSSVLAHFDTYLWGGVVALGEPLDLARVSLPQSYPFGDRCEVLVRWPPGVGCRFRRLAPFMRNGPVDEYESEKIGASGGSTMW